MAFRLGQLTDIHADYRSERHTNAQGVNLREADGYVALSTCITQMIQQKIDALLICGDVFHTPNPSMRAIIFVQNQFRRLSKVSIPVYALTGNHDTNDIRADVSASRVLHDPARKIFSHAEPYATHEIAPGIVIHMISHHMYSEQGDTMKEVKPVNGSINIFATHGSIVDPIMKIRMHTNQSPREIVIPDYMFNDYDWNYALLGHIHERGWVGSSDKQTDTANQRIYYNGSLIRRGFSDADVPLGRGWTLWEISDTDFKPTLFTVPQRPQIDFPIIDCSTLTSNEISERVIENLRSTQIDGSHAFDPVTAPILRQTFNNLVPSKHAALDWATFNVESSHAFVWKHPDSSMETTKIAVDSEDADVSDIQEGTDIVTVYDKWVESSTAMAGAEDAIKDRIKKETRDFVEAGQEAVLSDG